MSNDGNTDPFSKISANPKILGPAGGFLLVLGILAALCGFITKDAAADRINMALAAAVLLSFG